MPDIPQLVDAIAVAKTCVLPAISDYLYELLYKTEHPCYGSFGRVAVIWV